MIETQERVIKGITYQITMFGSKEGSRVLARLMSHIGEPIGAVGDAKGDNAIASAVGKFVTGFTPDEVTFFCNAFAAKTVVVLESGVHEKLSQSFDLHFAGEYDAMLEWLIACIEVNYASFFVVLRERVEGVAGALAQRMAAVLGSRFPKASTGAPTASPATPATAPG